MNRLQSPDRSLFRQMANADSEDVNLTQLFGTLWRGKFLIALCTMVSIAIGVWYGYFYSTPLFTSNAVVALESRQDQVVDIDSVVTGLSGDQATVNTEVEVIRSRGLIEKLVLQLDLAKDPEFNSALRPEPIISIGKVIAFARSFIAPGDGVSAPRTERSELDGVIDQVLRKISVSNVRKSYVFQIRATTESAEKSAAIANSLAQLYILEQLETKFQATEQATTWLTDRVAELQVQLEAAEAEVKDFNTGAQLVSAEALAGLNVQLKDLRDRQRDTLSLRDASRARLAELETAADTDDLQAIAEVANDPTLNRTLTLMQQIGQQNPDRTAFDTRFGQIRARAELELTRAESQLNALDQTILDQEQQIETQSSDLVRLQQLEREAEASRLIYEFFLNRLKETSVQEGIQRPDSRVLSQAVVPRQPSAPRKSLILAVMAVLGFGAGSGIVLLREFGQNTFRDTTELEDRTGYTVIGQVPSIPARHRKYVLKYFMDKPTSAAAEAIRNLRTSVLLSNIDQPPQVIMSTSSIPQEGKTTQSMALALNLTGLGKRVLLIEGDIRRRIFRKYFDIDDEGGMLSVLAGERTLEDAVVHIPTLGADVLIGEKAKTNAADIFSSDSFARLIATTRDFYDYVIVDTPPVLAVPDARIIGRHVDAIIYSVKWDSTSHRQVREGLKSLEDVNLRVSGLVLSQINARGMKKYGYGDSYGAYSSYYDN
ncbi:MAG: polysaccharide biosynthesis tyrosine autokinase [Pseudomonadota bacterium]